MLSTHQSQTGSKLIHLRTREARTAETPASAPPRGSLAAGAAGTPLGVLSMADGKATALLQPSGRRQAEGGWKQTPNADKQTILFPVRAVCRAPAGGRLSATDAAGTSKKIKKKRASPAPPVISLFFSQPRTGGTATSPGLGQRSEPPGARRSGAGRVGRTGTWSGASPPLRPRWPGRAGGTAAPQPPTPPGRTHRSQRAAPSPSRRATAFLSLPL